MRHRPFPPSSSSLPPWPVGAPGETGGYVIPPSTSLPTAREGTVVVKGVAFNPKEVQTSVGKEVVWTFDDGGLEHTVTADDGSFDSGRGPVQEGSSRSRGRSPTLQRPRPDARNDRRRVAKPGGHDRRAVLCMRRFGADGEERSEPRHLKLELLQNGVQ